MILKFLVIKKMRKAKVILFLAVLISPIWGICQEYHNVSGLPPIIGQEHSQWCYAATTQMVLKSINPSFSMPQCEIANRILRPPTIPSCDCCKYIDCPRGSNSNANGRTPCDVSCNKGLPSERNPAWIRFLKTNRGIDSGYNPTINTLNFVDIKYSIDNDFPVILLAKLSSDLTHAMVVLGYYITAKDRSGKPLEALLWIQDPASQCNGCRFLMTYNIVANSFVSKNMQTRFSTRKGRVLIKMIYHKKP
jgi:hypothetical protein